MSRLTVNQIFTEIASTVNQEATAPASTSSEYSLWLSFLNRGIREWAEANDWESLKKTFYPNVTGISCATVALPDDYKKLANSPQLFLDNSNDVTSFPEILEEEAGIYLDTDKYITETGNVSDGFALVFHPGTLSSGASIAIQYYSIPTSLASPSQYPMVPDSEFLIDRTISYIFEGRSDPRYQINEAKARNKLLLMVEDANLSKYNSYSNPNYIGNGPLKRSGFRIGRN